MDDIYAFACAQCGVEAFDGEGDGDLCDDCYEEELIEEEA